MNISYTAEAQNAFNAASEDVQKSANSLLGSYSHYVNRHSLPGKGTLKRISAEARTALNLPAGTQVFRRG